MSKKELNIGILGFGTVGTGVAKILLNNGSLLARRAGKKIILKRIADLDIKRDRGLKLKKDILTTAAAKVLTDPEIDIVVEVIGGVKPAKDFIIEALKNKKHVVTSNKEVIAKHSQEFIKLAQANNVNIYFEAAAGGGIPIINAISKALTANNITNLYGIVNGTTNYILSKMHRENAEFDTVLKEAQKLGYAEADPTNDIDGYDVAYKLAILAGLAFNAHFDYQDIYREGIRGITVHDIALAEEFDSVIKLLAIGKEHPDHQVELRVHPVMIKKDHPLAAVNDSYNAVFVIGDAVGETMFYGRGAGELPTASAVVGDIVDIAMNYETARTSPALDYVHAAKKIVPMGDIYSKYFLRLIVKDQPGVLAAISKVFGDNQVSIKAVQQKDSYNVDAELVIITHAVKESFMQKAVKEIKKIGTVIKVCSLIRAGL